MATVKVNLGEDSYEIEIRRGLLDEVGEKIRSITPKAEKVAVITDDNVSPLYGARFKKILEKSGFEVRIISFPAGEESKNLGTFGNVLNALAEFDMSRSDVLVTLSGGVPGDLGGFAASAYMRGIPFYQIPTSILAQIDSSVGGKVAVDLPGGKNLAGAFYQPKGVFIDPDLLETLPTRYVHDGLAEAVKYGCIGDAELFEIFENLKDREDLKAHIEEIILHCVLQKARVVEEDQFDNGGRQVLNFGHTIGHGVERYFNYGTYTHGEGVAIGMSLITAQSEKLGITEKGTAERILKVLKKLSLPTSIGIPAHELIPEIMHDKKRRGKKMTLVLLEKIGKSKLLTISTDELKKYIVTGQD
ncbi:3-dehydroquinate synthase [Dialister sp.]|uniref:3-dehydroquinate synthase n=1 Tax=Dialister sp. TaxID=1955814 RepID=UPI002E81704B|nr:3-dehydroquinate synthase [Dialister sp.]MEE3453255.1 3-dehydroquinate synthase [Dialister sp.]